MQDKNLTEQHMDYSIIEARKALDMPTSQIYRLYQFTLIVIITLTNISYAYATISVKCHHLTPEEKRAWKETRKKEKKPLEFYLKDIDMNNLPNCTKPRFYFFLQNEAIDKCGALFIKKL